MEAPGTTPLTIEQAYNSSYSQLKTRTSTNTSTSSITNYYNAQGQLYRTVDSSENAITSYDYQYQGEKINTITSTSVAAGEKQKTIETHTWFYDEQGKPVRMLRVRDQRDSSEIRLTLDEKGQVAEEQVFRKNIPGEKIYYYYDDGGRLTDVVRYQDKLGKLIPDHTFDYDSNGKLVNMMVVQNSGMDYVNWRYEYDPRGLLTRESCFSRQKKLVGKVEYSYEFKR
jgi:hypothetical protein